MEQKGESICEEEVSVRELSRKSGRVKARSVIAGIVVLLSSVALEARRTPWVTSKVKGVPGTPAPFRVVDAFPALKFERPVAVAVAPGSGAEGELAIVEFGGRVLAVSRRGESRELIDLRETSRTGNVFDMTFDPDFAKNRQIYFCFNADGQQPRTRVSRFRFLDGDAKKLGKIDPASEEVLFRWNAGGHNGACLDFGPDGYLYIATGDGVGPNPPDRNNSGQDISDYHGAVLRIDVRRRDGEKAYAVPADNPFVDRAGAKPEVWAYGFRNPWRMGFDRKTGELWLADVGWETWEMVHRIVRGGNYGWSRMEGRMLLRPEIEPGPTPIIPPVKDHPRSEANSITGGVVYHGALHESLRGAFVYGEYVTGRLWSLKEGADGAYECRDLADTDLHVIDFVEDEGGRLWVLDFDYTQKVWEIVPSGLKPNVEPFPRKLSETGIFQSVEKLLPAPGVLPYRVVAEPWMDGASAVRHVAIPGGGKVGPNPQADSPRAWAFPEGTVLVRTLSLPAALVENGRPGARQNVETQLLHYELGSWRPYTYAWNADGTDAELIGSAGEDRTVRVPDPHRPGETLERVWRYGGSGECTLCHNAPIGSVLGFERDQLDVPIGDGSSSWLTLLASDRVIDSEASAMARRMPKLVDPHDTTQPLEERARSYLHTNCGVCHNSGGDTTISIFFRRELSFSDLKVARRPGVGDFGVDRPWILRPGDPFGSVMLYRMNKLGYARMPHVGSRSVDSKGVALIEDWISSLKPAEKRTTDIVAAALRAVRDVSSTNAEVDAAIDRLLATTSGALATAIRIHRDEIPLATRQRIITNSQQHSSPDVRGIFETFVPDAERKSRLGEAFDADVVLSRRGDVKRGELIFHSDSNRCKSCHPSAKGAEAAKDSLGPDLRGLSKKHGRAELLRHIVEPSFQIAPEYATWLLVTTTGATHTGLLVEKTARQVVLKDAEKKLIRVPASSVAALTQQKTSMMPKLLLRDLSPQEAADLLEFLAKWSD